MFSFLRTVVINLLRRPGSRTIRQGLRLARPLLEQAGLSDQVTPRAGWAEVAAAVPAAGLLADPSATRFDDEEALG